MKKTSCDICQKTDVPLNDTLKIEGKTYCAACIQATFPNDSHLELENIEKEFDPTVCVFCEKDFGSRHLSNIANYPVCEDCETDIRNRTFPTWVKAFLAAIVVIVIGAFFWNWKYYQAYNDIKTSNNQFTAGFYTQAAERMTSASEKVPEVEELSTLASYFRGIARLTEDKSAEALVEFNQCADKMPAEYNMGILINQATIGATFDNKDYEGFLKASMKQLELDSSNATFWTSIASAYACIYADKGDESARKNAFLYLQKARSIDSTSADAREYYNMVEYRIDSKKIISREEFLQQFPNGWTKK